MEQKINEENIENNLVFCIHPRRTLAIKFRNPSYKNKIRLFSNSVKFGYRFLYKNHDETDCVSDISQERLDLDCNF